MALSQLEFLLLGNTCPENTCATIVACLLLISVYCLKLGRLEVHFNTTNIIEDLKNISEDPRFHGLRSLPRCALTRLDVWSTPLTLGAPGFETVVNWMVDILPSLEFCQGFEHVWGGLNREIAEHRKKTPGTSSVSITLYPPFA